MQRSLLIRVLALTALTALLSLQWIGDAWKELFNFMSSFQSFVLSLVGALVWMALAVSVGVSIFGRNPNLSVTAQYDRGLAGKTFGVPFPNFLMPVSAATILCISILGLVRQVRPELQFIGILIALTLSGAYFRQLITRHKRRRMLDRRDDLSEDELLRRFGYAGEKDRDSSRAALVRVAAEIDTSPGKLRPVDRFGHELGTFSILDPTLDRLAGWLLEGKKASQGEGIDLSRIQTLRDFVDSWISERQISSGSRGHSSQKPEKSCSKSL